MYNKIIYKKQNNFLSTKDYLLHKKIFIIMQSNTKCKDLTLIIPMLKNSSLK